MSTPQWAPTEILELDLNSSEFRCVGYATSKGRRCRNPIACANRQEASKVLLEMSRLDPQSQRLDEKLEELASRLLCKRNHQNQGADMKRQWSCKIENYLAAENSRLEALGGRENHETDEDETDQRESEEHVHAHAHAHERPHAESLHTHDRRAIEGDCAICCDDLSTGSDTVWCRAQCRQNFHAECLNLWHASQVAHDYVKTCPYW